MLAFRISLNGKHRGTAGVPGAHTLCAIAHSIVRADRVVREAKAEGRRIPKRELTFSLFGSLLREDLSGEHVDWLAFDLKPGDQLLLQVLETDTVDPPKRRTARAAPAQPGEGSQSVPRKKPAAHKRRAPTKKPK
jgi:hypothetical protein